VSGDVAARLEAAARRLSPEVKELARRIYENPELSGDEHRAHGWCTDLLASHGFAVRPVSGVGTAFAATITGTAPGPAIGLLAEYDALPELGHACGHHLIAGSAVGAGIVLAACRDALPGTVTVYGCPAEETGRGKVAMLEAGAFAELDAALTFHAHDVTSIMWKSTGIRELRFRFTGTAAHASSDPWAGASALDGVLLTYQNVNALRQFVRDGVRIHGIVTEGGQAFNTVPERAECQLAVRSADGAELERVVRRVIECAQAARLASGTELTIEHGISLDPVRPSGPLAEVVRSALEALDQSVEEWIALPSTDFGNVSCRVPSLLFSVKTWPAGTAFHTREAAALAGEPAAFEAMMTGVRAMARSAGDLLASPGLVRRARTALEADRPEP
jgi:amidohydrolase